MKPNDVLPERGGSGFPALARLPTLSRSDCGQGSGRLFPSASSPRWTSGGIRRFENKEAARASFENGDADLANAYLILNNPRTECLFGIACFHCHQAVEKYLKGYLLFNSEQPPLIHDLKLLLDKCVEFDKTLSQFDDDCRDLNPYYIETRYEPGAPSDFDESEARVAYQKSERMIETIKTRSPL